MKMIKILHPIAFLGAFIALADLSRHARAADITREAWIQASDRQISGAFGAQVGVSGDTMLVTGRDSAYVLVRNGTSWSEQAVIDDPTAGSGAFGWAGAISGDTIVVGAPLARPSGAVYVFVRDAGGWSQQAVLTASNPDSNDQFGRAVAILGDTIVVGAQFEASNATGVNGDQNNDDAQYSGAVYVFVRSGANWTQQAYLKASNTHFNGQFGCSLGIDGNTLIVGSRGESNFFGAAYVFVREATTWSQQAYLKASNPEYYDHFGDAVAISGNTIVVSAPYEGSSATGINGNQNDNSLVAAGAAYVFVRSGTTWTQQAYLKASNTGQGDFFGASLAISGETMVVGALGEASKATTINGNQNDNSLPSAGAAYVFIRGRGAWSQFAYLKSPGTKNGGVFATSVAISGDTIAAGAPYEGQIEGAVSVFRAVGLPPPDSDGDGITDSDDECSNTPAGAIVDGTGCSIDQLVPCDGPWLSHGHYLQALRDISADFRAAGLITAAQQDAILRAGARSDCGKERKR